MGYSRLIRSPTLTSLLCSAQQGSGALHEVSVSLYVCRLCASISPEPHVQVPAFTEFSTHAAVVWSSASGVAIRYVLPVLWMTSHFPIVGAMGHVDIAAVAPLHAR